MHHKDKIILFELNFSLKYCICFLISKWLRKYYIYLFTNFLAFGGVDVEPSVRSCVQQAGGSGYIQVIDR